MTTKPSLVKTTCAARRLPLLPTLMLALLAGFNPHAVALPPVLYNPSLQGGAFGFTYLTQPGNTCRVEVKALMTDPTWTLLSTWVSPMAGVYGMTVANTFNSTQLYRVYDQTAGQASVNVVGYSMIVIPANSASSMVVNPFISTPNTLGAIIPNPPDLTEVRLRENAVWHYYLYDLDSGGWVDEAYDDASSHPMPPAGTGFYVTALLGDAITLAFAGDLPVPPTIYVEPQSCTNLAGTTAHFTVTAMGIQPFGYQWRRSNTNLLNAGNVSGVFTDTLTLTGVSLADAANYSVIITNGAGSVTSGVATLTVTSTTESIQISSQLLSSSQVRLSIVGLEGTKYALDRSFSLRLPNWLPQVTNPAGVGGVLVFTNAPIPNTNNFWRVRSVR